MTTLIPRVSSVCVVIFLFLCYFVTYVFTCVRLRRTQRKNVYVNQFRHNDQWLSLSPRCINSPVSLFVIVRLFVMILICICYTSGLCSCSKVIKWLAFLSSFIPSALSLENNSPTLINYDAEYKHQKIAFQCLDTPRLTVFHL